MKLREFLIPLLSSFAVTPFCLALAFYSAGLGHGDYFWAKVYFPFTMLSAVIFGRINDPFIALAIVQFPLYGLLVGSANICGRLLGYLALTSLTLIHSLAVIACFVLLTDNFS